MRVKGRHFPMSLPSVQQERSIPPYVSYRTFRNFLEWLGAGIPARIDRSFWGQRLSGGSGTQLMTALRVLNLIDPQHRPTQSLDRLVQSTGADRRRFLRELLERHYAPVFALDLRRATRAQFHESFRTFGTREGVIAKCEAFFIQAAQDAGVELSSFILARRHGARRGKGAGRTRSQSPEKSATLATVVPGVSQRPIAQMVMEKYPEFDPAWAPEVQARWLDGIARLYEDLRESDE